MLCVYGNSLTNDKKLVEDTIQELFVTIWIKRKSIKITSSPDSYLLVAFRNNLKKQLTKPIILALEPYHSIVEEVIVAADYEEHLKLAFEKLPRHQREVIFLRYYKNLSFKEISQHLDISYQVARNFASRAIKFMRKNIHVENSDSGAL